MADILPLTSPQSQSVFMFAIRPFSGQSACRFVSFIAGTEAEPGPVSASGCDSLMEAEQLLTTATMALIVARRRRHGGAGEQDYARHAAVPGVSATPRVAAPIFAVRTTILSQQLFRLRVKLT